MEKTKPRIILLELWESLLLLLDFVFTQWNLWTQKRNSPKIAAMLNISAT